MNPFFIQRFHESVLQRMPVTDALLEKILGGESLKSLHEAKRLYVCDYARLDGIQTMANKKGHMTVPIVLLFVTKDKKLMPLAIQLFQEVGSPIFIPTKDDNGQGPWTLAKLFVQQTETSYQIAVDHIGLTHKLWVPFYLAAVRCLGEEHPTTPCSKTLASTLDPLKRRRNSSTSSSWSCSTLRSATEPCTTHSSTS